MSFTASYPHKILFSFLESLVCYIGPMINKVLLIRALSFAAISLRSVQFMDHFRKVLTVDCSCLYTHIYIYRLK